MNLGRFNILFLLVILFGSFSLSGQKLVSVINDAEQSVFTVESYKKDSRVKDIASGFFISADGIAVTKASLFLGSDSVVVKMRNGKLYLPDKIISVHPYANLALIKIKRQRRQKGIPYLQLSRSTIAALHEVLIFCDPSQAEKGIVVENVKSTGSFPFIGRYGIIEPNLGSRSFGAPVINLKGKLTGIYGSDEDFFTNVIYSSGILNDSLWVDINIDAIDKTSVHQNKKLFVPYLNHAVLFYLSGDYTEASKFFTYQMKYSPDSYNLYCLRAMARFKDDDRSGGESDIDHAKELYPNGSFATYVKGMYYLESGEEEEAYDCFKECLMFDPEFTPAKVEHARLEWKLYNRIQKAYSEFNEVIDLDSLNGDAYYERARLSLQFSSNEDLAFEDLNRAIYLDPSLPGVYSLRGVMKLSKKDFQSAINDFTKAIEHNKNDVHAYFNRGIAFFNIGMKKSACKDWKRAGDLGNYSAYKYISRYCSGSVTQRY